jgi:Uma2 family endonuclease
MTAAVAAPPQTPPPKAVGPSSPPTAPAPAPYRLSVKQYQQMIRAGILGGEDKVELINGIVVQKMAKNPPHESCLALLIRAFRMLPDTWQLRVQGAIELTESQPEPDGVIARGDPRTYGSRHPEPPEIGVLIEASDSSLSYDRGDKLRLYARAGIAEYWIINLVDNRVEVYTQPSGPTAVPTYATAQTYLPGQAIPLALDGAAVATIPVADLLP